MKGYFKVSEKVDILDALKKFPNRQNVIISHANSKKMNLPWNNEKRYDIWKNIGRKRNPGFLKEFVYNEMTYYQRTNDDHKIDQWKYSGIFNCNILIFQKWVANNKCIKENNVSILKKITSLGVRKFTVIGINQGLNEKK